MLQLLRRPSALLPLLRASVRFVSHVQSSGDLNMAYELFEDALTTGTTPSYNALLRMFLDHLRPLDVHSVLRLMNRNNVPPDLTTLELVGRLCVLESKETDARLVLREVLARSRSNKETYTHETLTILLANHVTTGDAVGAAAICEIMATETPSSLNHALYGCMRAFITTGDVARALSLMEQLVEPARRPTSYYLLLGTAFMAQGTPQKAVDVYRRLAQLQLPETSEVVLARLRALVGVKDLDGALGVLRSVTDPDRHCIPSRIMCKTVAEALEQMGRVEEATRLMENEWNSTSPTALTRLQDMTDCTYRNTTTPEEVWDMANKAQREGIGEHSVQVDRTFVEFMVRKRGSKDKHLHDVDSAACYIRSIAERRIVPDVMCCNAILSGFVRTESLSSAVSFFQEMHKWGMAMTSDTYSILIHGSAWRGEFDKSVNLIWEAWSSGLELPSNVYLFLVRLCIRTKNFVTAETVLFLLRRSGLDESGWLVRVILLLGKAGRADLATAMVNNMQRDVSVPVQEALVRACVDSEDLVSARRYIDECPHPTPNMIKSLGLGLSRVGQLDDKFAVFEEMHAARVCATWDLAIVLVKACLDVEDVDRALRVIDTMEKEEGVKLNDHVVAEVITALLERNRDPEAWSFLSSCEEKIGSKMLPLSWAAFLVAFGKRKDVSSMKKTAQEMRKKGVPFDTTAYNALVFAYAMAGQSRNAVFMLQWMLRSSRHRPRARTLVSVVRACLTTGWIGMAQRVIEIMNQMDLPLPDELRDKMIEAKGRRRRKRKEEEEKEEEA